MLTPRLWVGEIDLSMSSSFISQGLNSIFYFEEKHCWLITNVSIHFQLLIPWTIIFKLIFKDNLWLPAVHEIWSVPLIVPSLKFQSPTLLCLTIFAQKQIQKHTQIQRQRQIQRQSMKHALDYVFFLISSNLMYLYPFKFNTSSLLCLAFSALVIDFPVFPLGRRSPCLPIGRRDQN